MSKQRAQELLKDFVREHTNHEWPHGDGELEFKQENFNYIIRDIVEILEAVINDK